MRIIQRHHMLAYLGILLISLNASAAFSPTLNCALIIDPGHGGLDQGAQITEEINGAEINLDIARHLRDFLSRYGVRVYLTRDVDDFVLSISDSRQRVNRAYAQALAEGVPHENTALIALHADALSNESLSGVIAYIPNSMMGGGEIARLLSEELTSQCFAEAVLGKLREQRDRFPVHDTGDSIRSLVRKAGKVYSPAVLRYTFPPARILIEAGNASNPSDVAHLTDPAWRRDFAYVLSEAYVEHFMPPKSHDKATEDVRKNEENAVRGLRIMNDAQASYYEKHQCFAPSLQVLIEEEPYYMESSWAEPREGYVFEIRQGATGYAATGTPLHPGLSGQKWFYTDGTGVIRYSTEGPANERSQILDFERLP